MQPGPSARPPEVTQEPVNEEEKGEEEGEEAAGLPVGEEGADGWREGGAGEEEERRRERRRELAVAVAWESLLPGLLPVTRASGPGFKFASACGAQDCIVLSIASSGWAGADQVREPLAATEASRLRLARLHLSTSVAEASSIGVTRWPHWPPSQCEEGARRVRRGRAQH
eukprot:2851110-Rhodomonas_salina.1